MVSRQNVGDAGPDLHHNPRNLVPGNQRRPDASPEDAVHNQQVVMAEPASLDLDENFEVANSWRRHVRNDEARKIGGLLQNKGFHQVSILAIDEGASP